MLVLGCGVVWCGLVLYLLARAVLQFRMFRRATLPVASGASDLTVSIIVPARDEIANIELCLAGLSAQTGLSHRSSIIVVDGRKAPCHARPQGQAGRGWRLAARVDGQAACLLARRAAGRG
jgi:cellulose synthase/poly-beta-1,6-N-acetylglucosamine synthase-like glycosyltransferase